MHSSEQQKNNDDQASSFIQVSVYSETIIMLRMRYI
jgi:hypothetical protein